MRTFTILSLALGVIPLGASCTPYAESNDREPPSSWGGAGGALPVGAAGAKTSDDCGAACAPGLACCAGTCVDLADDVAHCGSCERACSAVGGEAECHEGVCAVACDLDRLDCDGAAETGCEQSDPGPPEAVELLRPLVGTMTGSLRGAAITGALRPTFTWSAPTGAACDRVSYHFQLDDSCEREAFADCTFDSPEVDVVLVDPRFTPEHDLPVSRDVPVGTRYYFRVRACDELERCSAYGEVRYVDVGRERQDVTGDGYADIVGLDEGQFAGRYTIYAGAPDWGVLHNGSPLMIMPSSILFEAGSTRTFAEEHPPVVRFVGDVDGDGFHDFVADGPEGDLVIPAGATSSADGAIHCPTRLLYLGRPDATAIRPVFFSARSWAPDSLAHNFAAGDFDADGYADIWAAQSVLSGLDPATESGVLLLRGRPGLTPVADPDAVTVTDFDQLMVLRARPDDPSELLGVSVEPGDFNGDGQVDVAVVAPTAKLVYLVLGGASDGVVDRAIPYGGVGAGALDCRFARLSVADFDADGFDDFAINCAEQRLLEVYRGGQPLPETVAFSRLLNPDVAESLLDTLAADFDADGRPELVSGRGDGPDGPSSSWLLAEFDAGLDSQLAQALEVARGNGYFGAADHDGDGYVDLFFGGGSAGWVRGTGRLDFRPSSSDGASIVQSAPLLGSAGNFGTRSIGR